MKNYVLVLLIVFDLTRFDSLINCQKWTQEALAANHGHQPFIFLIGAKRDLLVNHSKQQYSLTRFTIIPE